MFGLIRNRCLDLFNIICNCCVLTHVYKPTLSYLIVNLITAHERMCLSHHCMMITEAGVECSQKPRILANR